MNLLRVALASTLLLFCSSCLAFKPGSSGKNKSGSGNPDWPEEMKRTAVKEKYDQAFGIFSYSGMSNAGHVMIYQKKGNSYADLQWVEADGKSITSSKKVEGEKFKELQKTIASAAKLEDYDKQSFDGIVFTYYAIDVASGKTEEKKKLVMNNPPERVANKPDSQQSAHRLVIDALYGLAK